MLQAHFDLFANPGAALLVGLFAVTLLVSFKRHRDASGNSSPPKLVACMLLTMIAYLSLVITVGNFFVNIPTSTIVRENFGDQRVAWLFVGLLADSVARVYALFD